MNETLYQGWTPPVKKVCTRCRGDNDNPLQELCQTCREGDELAKWIDENCAEIELSKDEAYTKEINRP
jgi:hypothetical protein